MISKLKTSALHPKFRVILDYRIRHTKEDLFYMSVESNLLWHNNTIINNVWYLYCRKTWNILRAPSTYADQNFSIKIWNTY